MFSLAARRAASGPDTGTYAADMGAKTAYMILLVFMLLLMAGAIINAILTAYCVRFVLRQERIFKRPDPPATREPEIPAAREPEVPVSPCAAEPEVEVDLRRRPTPPLVCYYVHGGKKMHTDKTCCGMGNPQQVSLPAAAVPFVAWCRHCSAELIPK